MNIESLYFTDDLGQLSCYKCALDNMYRIISRWDNTQHKWNWHIHLTEAYSSI